MLLQHVPADTGAWAGTKAQLGRNTGCYSLEWQAGKATGAHRGGLVPAGQSVAWHAPGCARVAARPQAQVQRRAPANTPDLRHHINDIFIAIYCDFMLNLSYTIYVICPILLFSVYLYLIVHLIYLYLIV